MFLYLLFRGAVFNALITGCLDKICRIWTETVLPEDSFSVNVNRDLQPNDAKFHRTHKHRIMKRLQHVKYVLCDIFHFIYIFVFDKHQSCILHLKLNGW